MRSDVMERIIPDGDSVAIVDENFVNLQESDAIWFEANEFAKAAVHWLINVHGGYSVIKLERLSTPSKKESED